MTAPSFSRLSPLCCSATARTSLPPIFTLAYRFRLFFLSTPSVRTINAIPSAAYRFRLFSPLQPPSVWAINAIPPSANRFRLYLPSAPFFLAMTAIPCTAYRFRPFLPSKLSNILSIVPQCMAINANLSAWLSTPTSVHGYQRQPQCMAINANLSAWLSTPTSCRHSFRIFLPSSLCCTRISGPFLPPTTAPGFSRHSPLCCSATPRASSADFYPRLPLSAFLAANANV
jgi:hypothetical protein